MLREVLLDGIKDKVQIAIERIRAHAPLDGSPVIVADSGGKDSCVIMDLVKQSGIPFRPIHNFTQVDPPELIQFLHKHHPETVFSYPKRPITKAIRSNGLPTRWRRWCCDEYKHGRREKGVYVLGVRWEESAARAKRWRLYQHCGKVDQYSLCPIIDWSEEDVWEYIRERNLPYCSLYDEGFKRLGCVMCPLVDNMARDMERWPKIAGIWKAGAKKRFDYILERDGENCRYKTVEDLWYWWINGQKGDGDKGEKLDFEE